MRARVRGRLSGSLTLLPILARAWEIEARLHYVVMDAEALTRCRSSNL